MSLRGAQNFSTRRQNLHRESFAGRPSSSPDLVRPIESGRDRDQAGRWSDRQTALTDEGTFAEGDNLRTARGTDLEPLVCLPPGDRPSNGMDGLGGTPCRSLCGERPSWGPNKESLDQDTESTPGTVLASGDLQVGQRQAPFNVMRGGVDFRGIDCRTRERCLSRNRRSEPDGCSSSCTPGACSRGGGPSLRLTTFLLAAVGEVAGPMSRSPSRACTDPAQVRKSLAVKSAPEISHVGVHVAGVDVLRLPSSSRMLNVVARDVLAGPPATRRSVT
jgi:hypothetical protein